MLSGGIEDAVIEAAPVPTWAPDPPRNARVDWQAVDHALRSSRRRRAALDPEARTHVVRFELSAETFALLRQARTVLDDEHGTNLPDDEFVAELCGAALDGVPQGELTGRAKFQIAVTVCQRCGQGWQEGAGARIAIDPAAVERALCDVQHIGSIDG